jgi:hypothetical protein
MKQVEEKRATATKDGIFPNFKILASYDKHFGEYEFYSSYARLRRRGIFKQAEKIIKEYKLQSFKSDLIYFLIRSASTMDSVLWAKKENPQKLNADRRKQEKMLLEFISKLNRVNFDSQYSWSKIRSFPELKEIKFITDKKDSTLKIDSFYLCEELLDLIEKLLTKDEVKSAKTSSKINTSPRQYEKKFVLGLKPFIEYLAKETIRWPSRNKIYDCVSELLDTLDINISSTRIKDTLKAK